MKKLWIEFWISISKGIVLYVLMVLAVTLNSTWLTGLFFVYLLYIGHQAINGKLL